MNLESKIYVAGHRGMVGSAIVRKLKSEGHEHIIGRTSSELDLKDQKEVVDFFKKQQPNIVVVAAAKVGGIHANNVYRADFLYENLMIQNNVIHQAHAHGVEKLLFLGSSCIYPKLAPQPLKEDYLLTGLLEPTNEPYAIAKISGIKMCEAYRDQYDCNFISAMPTNLYGPNDNYHPENSHVLPAMLRRFHEAKIRGDQRMVCWGSGRPKREFLHVNDLAEACYHMLMHYDEKQFLNIGTGKDVTIKELAETIAGVVGYEGAIDWDTSKPDGTPRKLMDVSRAHAMGWRHRIDLKKGIEMVYGQEVEKGTFSLNL